jgi:hypothetical protein
VKAKELIESASPDILIHYFLKEVEVCWRMKFSECSGAYSKDSVDQIVLLIDLKGAKLKDLSNKQVKIYLSFHFCKLF